MLLLKIAVLAIVDAMSLFAIFTMVAAGSWPVAVATAIVAIALNILYFGDRWTHLKFLAPGLILLFIFQVFLILYSLIIAFSNYGFGHNSTKDDAIAALTVQGLDRVPDSPSYRLTVVDGEGGLSFLVTDPDGVVSVGSATTPLAPADDVELDDSGVATGLAGYTSLTFADILARQSDVTGLEVPISEDPVDGVLRTGDGRTAYLYQSTLIYDPELDAMLDTTTGTLFYATAEGLFESEEGVRLLPGWRVFVGLENFQRILVEGAIGGDLLRIFAWTMAFAGIVTFGSFFIGIFLALVFNDIRLRGRTIYRAIVILPYAFPAFLSILIFSGLLNTQFGFINQVLLDGAEIPWLRDPWLARLSVIGVAIWLTVPFKFLVGTGALQSIPIDLEEAATLDGAGKWQLFRGVRLPLLLVTMAPLLISSFAFTFNGFNIIWLMTKGGPVDLNSPVNAGATDLMITLVYKIAFVNKLSDFGLASAFTIVIFFIIGTISLLAFRKTKRFEEIL